MKVWQAVRTVRGLRVGVALLLLWLFLLVVNFPSAPITECHHPFFKPRPAKQFSLDYGYVHDAKGLCSAHKDGDGARPQSGDAPTDIDVVILVLTMSQHVAERQAIRSTYGSVSRGSPWPAAERQVPDERQPERVPGTVRVVFLIGQNKDVLHRDREAQLLAAESRMHGDLVQWDGLVEDYSNLTMKVLLGLRWVRDRCPRARHIIKTDDDTFIHLPRFFQHLQRPSSHIDPDPSRVIRGAAYCDHAGVLREGKYAVSEESFSLDQYPPHVKGQIYSMPLPLAVRILQVAEFMPYNRMEDVHVTGTLGCVVGARHYGFTVQEFNYCAHNCSACDFSDGVRLAARHLTPDNFRQVWGAITQPDKCSKLTRTLLKVSSYLRPTVCYFFL